MPRMRAVPYAPIFTSTARACFKSTGAVGWYDHASKVRYVTKFATRK